ncbi:SMI1/KNR4 family protein [Streptomyces aureocirculatus]|uniref:SMI1/KNR4 family protein n=1 Tax=Streptomyces aureocirculatus TaxID=67275 RepID=UPI0012FEB2F4|nr:SMI1/KNR4 family protein [Streptomyces aureocirculatus]
MSETMEGMSSSRIIRAWNRIDAWLAEHAPVTFAALPQPATPVQVALAERMIGVTFPRELAASLGCHNGSDDHTLLSAELIARDFLLTAEISRQPGIVSQVNTETPEWLPITSDSGGGHMILDLLGERQPRVGFRSELTNITFPETPNWSNLSSLLEHVASSLETMKPVDGCHPIISEGELLWDYQ